MRFMIGFAMAACLAATAHAEGPGEVGGLPAFKAVELHDDGVVDVRYGADQKVALIAGDRWQSTFTVTPDGRLVIHGCKGCGETVSAFLVVTPRAEGLAVLGEGRMEALPGFPRQDQVALKVVQGGTVLATNLSAREATVRRERSGDVLKSGRPIAWSASVSGNGEILYTGTPALTISPLRRRRGPAYRLTRRRRLQAGRSLSDLETDHVQP